MSRNRTESLLRRKLYTHGSPVEIQHYTEADGGSRGPEWQPGEADQINAYPDTSGGSRQLGELFGVELQNDIAFTVLESELSDQATDGGHAGASHVTYNGRDYVVEHIEDNGTPAVVLHCTTEQDN